MIETDAPRLLQRPKFLCETLTPRGYAQRVGVSLTTIHKWLDDEINPLPAGYIGNKRLIHVPTADAWLQRKLGIADAGSGSPASMGTNGHGAP